MCAVGSVGEIQTSPDGITWTQRTAAGGYSDILFAVASDGQLLVTVGQSSEIQTSPDGITWTQRVPAPAALDSYGAVSDGARFLICGESGTIQTSLRAA